VFIVSLLTAMTREQNEAEKLGTQHALNRRGPVGLTRAIRIARRIPCAWGMMPLGDNACGSLELGVPERRQETFIPGAATRNF